MSLLGESVNLTVVYPNVTTPISSTASSVVSATAVEYPNVDLYDLPNDAGSVVAAKFDLTGSRIYYEITDQRYSSFANVGSGEINGYVFNFERANIRDVEIIQTNNQLAIPDAWVTHTANSVSINVDGLSFEAGDNLLLQLSFNLSGTAGSDVVQGDAGDDFLSGFEGADTLFGGFGDDTIQAGAGNDIAFGGQGDGADSISAGVGFDQVYAGAGNDTVAGGADGDVLGGGLGADAIDGGSGDDAIYGGGGDFADQARGGQGNDVIYVGAGNDTVTGNEGNDTIGGGAGADVIRGGSGDDVIYLGLNDGAADTFQTGSNDEQGGGSGNGNDTLYAFENGRDHIDVRASGITQFSQLSVNSAADGDAVITLASGQTITLDGVAAGQVDASDFIF